MDAKTKKLLSSWGVMIVLCLITGFTCIGFIFAPVSIFASDKNHQIIQQIAYPALSQQGAELLGESWKRFPNYTIGLGIAAGLSLAGAIYGFYNIYKEARN